MDQQEMLRIIAALVSRHTSGVCCFTAIELASAPVDALRFDRTAAGDTYVTIGGPAAYKQLHRDQLDDE